MISRVHASLSALVLLCALGACGGGGGAGPPAFASAPLATPSASPTPAGIVAVAPASFPSFTGANQTGTFTVTEPQYAGQFGALADPATCAPNGATVATVSPATAPAPNATFTITTGGTAGVCTIVVTDGFGQKQSVTVTVSITQGTLR